MCMFFFPPRPSVAIGTWTQYIQHFFVLNKEHHLHLCHESRGFELGQQNGTAFYFLFFFSSSCSLLMFLQAMSTHILKFDFHSSIKNLNLLAACVCYRVLSSFISKWACCITEHARPCRLSGTTWEPCRTKLGLTTERGYSGNTGQRLKQRGELICLNDIIMNEKIWDIIY